MNPVRMSADQREAIKRIVMLNFGSDSNSTSRFDLFISESIEIDIFNCWIVDSDTFDMVVSKVLRKLTSKKLLGFLDALSERVSENDQESAADIQKVRAALDEMRDFEQLLTSRKILIAANRNTAKFNDEIKSELQNLMPGFDIVGSWDEDGPEADEIDEIWAVIAFVIVLTKNGRVLDPPLKTLEMALQRLTPERRVIVIAMTNFALSWARDFIKTHTLNNCVETKIFFDDNSGRPIQYSSREYRADETRLLVQEVGETLLAAFEALPAQRPEVVARPLAAVPSRPGFAPIILLGEPRGQTAAESIQPLDALKAALGERGLPFEHWQDGWGDREVRAIPILARDPIFVRIAREEEIDTKRIADGLERHLRALLDKGGTTTSLLSGSRRVLWRPNSDFPWDRLVAGGAQSTEDLDNLEPRIDDPASLAEWLERFAMPDAIILHEELVNGRSPEFLRMLRKLMRDCLYPVIGRDPMIRLRTFSESWNFADDKLTVVAMDDLPLPAGPDFRTKAITRFQQFRDTIDYVLSQRRMSTGTPSILQVAMLVQEAGLTDADFGRGAGLEGWKPFRIKRNDGVGFHPESGDADALRQATIELHSARHRGKAEPRTSP
ncbi:hypothetical protein MBUL_03170 [Methylobacterium bullatum]|uniref:Uncharacterized protein n=1 Tax=Methylobacterium bullatum TaxID=570505 RepID=A0A679JHJ6_9HYPH|nr:hypothetical protein MBUL_03170 [Methylobacterium bullatum]